MHDKDDMSILLNRLMVLEDQTRRLRHTLAAVLVISLCLLVLGFAYPSQRVVRAEKFVVVDVNGHERAVFGTVNDKLPWMASLRLVAPDSSILVLTPINMIIMNPKDGSNLNAMSNSVGMFNPADRSTISLKAEASGSGLHIFRSDTQSLISLRIENSGPWFSMAHRGQPVRPSP